MKYGIVFVVTDCFEPIGVYEDLQSAIEFLRDRSNLVDPLDDPDYDIIEFEIK